MKKQTLSISLLILSLTCGVTCADDAYTVNTDGTTPTDSDALTKYVKTLGDYLGYNLDKDITPYEYMLDPTYTIASTGLQILDAFFGAIPVNSSYTPFTDNDTYQAFNDRANILFTDYHSPNTGDISVTAGFDEPTSKSDYQNDPVTQAIFNLVGTPSANTCSSNPASGGLQCLNQNEVMGKVIEDISDNGNPPGETLYFNSDYISKYISQLNVNTLTAPLIYTNTPEADNSGSGLPAANQLQQAATFIRYVTAAVIPTETMSNDDYNALRSQAQQSTDGKTTDEIKTINASKNQLANYLISQRVYAAQSSVAISNLYGILTKRMAQKVPTTSADGKSSTTTTSQAFNEFQSATWRLYDPAQSSSDNQWVNLINQSSAATVQKETAILLSEINYQLYLNRQMEERILLTNSLYSSILDLYWVRKLSIFCF
jgi:intracellular multiplication protein IcmX